MEGFDHGRSLLARLDALAAFSDVPDTLTRLYLSPSYRQAAEQVRTWMEAAGMRAWIDPVGNVVGRYEGDRPGLPALWLGSHIDTVRSAGKYDGNLGVLAAIACVDELARTGERLPFAIQVFAFGDEEGSRFPTTLSGSRAVAGEFDARTLDALDGNGVSLRQALIEFGGDPDAISAASYAPGDVLGYAELHIEQGPVLEAEQLALGVVTAISGSSRYIVEIIGVAGHAGTVPMGLRRDALAAAAEMISAIERQAQTTKGLVATVGRIEASPGAANVIPGSARFTIDIRAPDDATRRAGVASITREIADIAQRRNLAITQKATLDASACICDGRMIDIFSAAVVRAGIHPRLLPSGAGHDAMALVRLCPVGMLFVRCKGGISHNPLESITVEDADVAFRVFLDFIRSFALA